MNSVESIRFKQNVNAASPVKDESMLKGKDREERLRIARERLREEQKRRLAELRESIERAEETRRKQEECRRKKIEEMKRRDELHRASVEERRKRLLSEQNERNQAILRKSVERDSKFDFAKRKKSSGGLNGFCFRSLNASPSCGNSSSFGQIGSKQKVAKDKDFDPGASQRDRDRRHRFLSPTLAAQNSRSEGALSSLGRRSPATRPRPQGGADKLPGYACNTVSSQIRVGRNNEAVGTTRCVCPRFRSVSPLEKNRTRSVGNFRRSRADLRKTTDGSILKSVPAEVMQSMDSVKVASVQQKRNLALSRSGISKSMTSSEALGKSSTTKMTSNSAIRARVSAVSSKASRDSKGISTPPPALTKAMPSPPKSLTPRLLPKVVKDETSSRTATSTKRIVKAMHNIDNVQPSKSNKETNKKEQSSVGDEKEKRKLDFSNMEMDAGDKADDAKATSVEDEYKQKLAENRRLAREKAEREAEEQRQKDEQERRDEEERLRREEEEQRKREEEELRLLEEAKVLEEERFRVAVEEAERQRREEEERLEAERQEKIATEKRMQGEAEKKEKERQEKLRREEEERQERKKKIEMIMKRVKTDDNTNKEVKEQKSTEGNSVSAGNEEGFSKFMSPFLRQMMGNKLKGKFGGDSTTPAALTSSNNGNADLKNETNTDGINSNHAVEAPEETPANTSELRHESSASSISSVETVSSTNEADLPKTLAAEENVALEVTRSDIEVIDLTSRDLTTKKSSDDNQNWATSTEDLPATLAEPSLPDLPRIAYEETSANTLPDILL